MSEEEITLGFLLTASDKEIQQYRRYTNLPTSLDIHPYWSASNRVEWVILDTYSRFLREASDEKRKDTRFTCLLDNLEPLNVDNPRPVDHPRPVDNPKPLKRHASAEVIEISDSDSDSAAPQPRPPKKRVKHVSIKPELTVDAVPPAPSSSNESSSPVTVVLNKGGRISITQKESVAGVVELQKVPDRWPPKVDIAFILSMSRAVKAAVRNETFTGRAKGLDSYLKVEDQDSWGKGTNGSTTREPKLIILGGLAAPRSSHDCNGGLRCEFFDTRLIPQDYERTDLDMSLMQEIFARDLEQNENDSGTSIAVTASFFRIVKNLKCTKAGCTGRAVLKSLRDGPSNDGKTKFIGCSMWRMGEQYDHRYAALPSTVDEEVLAKYMAGTAIASDDVSEYDTDSCAHFIHPRHGKLKHCPHTHFRDGELVVREMVVRPCPAQKMFYTSKDNDNPMVAVIFRGRHSHPPWPMEKPGAEAKEDLAKCLEGMGTFGTTGGRLNNSNTTRALIGTDLSVKHVAYRNTRKLRDAVLSSREASTPQGLLWGGILDRYERDLALPTDQQYIHVLRMEGPLKLAVCLDSELAPQIHKVRYLVPDFTFKRLVSDLNEWEVAVWLDGTRERLTASRVYCNKSTTQAFMYIFDGFFMAIEKVTGQPVRFKAFDPEGNILSIHFDMEAAQVQGFALALLKLIKGRHPETDPDVIVRYVVKLCSVHFTRSTDTLVPAVGQETVDYLNRIRGFTSPDDIEAWHTFCRDHENKKLRDWYKHKIQYSWLLPGYNESLSLFPPGFWGQTPSHTNLVKSAHVATNQETGIKLLPLEAIERARAFDRARAVSIASAMTTCIVPNANNSDSARIRRTVTRSAHRKLRRNEHSELENGITEAKQELDEISKKKSSASLRLRNMVAEKKALGRAPRNSHLIDRYGNAGAIPQVLLQAESDTDSDVELVEGESSLTQQSSSPEPSSSLDFYDVDMRDNRSEELMSRPSSAPQSSSSGFDLASRASDFDFDIESGYPDFDQTEYVAVPESWVAAGAQGDEVDDAHHAGHYPLGAPGFDPDKFLAECGRSTT
ncbi:hypothetical protein DFH09DRAFT_1339782 [Mycena vulgaris]|nr:hypothetical protein DFH09DRAFT_1339782 [Mycena vulgaris]